MAVSRKFVKTLLESNSTKKFYIEYHGFLSNHLAHGIVALSRLGASKDRIEEFISEYTKDLEPTAERMKHCSYEESRVSMQPIGIRENYYGLLKFYESQVFSLGAKQAIAMHFPVLSSGLSGAAFHGLIQLGYGFSEDSEPVVAEGLAYLHFTGGSLDVRKDCKQIEPKCNTSLQDFRTSVSEVLDEIRKSGELTQKMLDNLEVGLSDNEKILGMFQKKMISLTRYASDDLNRYLCQIGDVERISTDWLIDVSLVLYDLTSRDDVDFFILHLVTSAWALTEISRVLDDASRNRAQKQFLLAALASYVARDCPELDIENSKLEVDETWEQLCEAAIQSKGDEHIYKLVQVAREMSERSADKGYMLESYKRAAKKTISLPFRF